MKNVLVTGGTVFVSRYVAEYYVQKGCNVYVLNRNSRPQSEGVTLIEADRHELGGNLRGHHFDAVFDVTAYTGEDVHHLLDALGSFGEYFLVSSSAVYPEYESQPFTEETPVGENKYWGKYGMGKIAAEKALLSRCPNAYILRPPYIYGPMNNVYRESFIFDCVRQGRKLYLPPESGMQLQFYHVEDLCRFMDRLMEEKPDQHIFNVGNRETISILEWVKLCCGLLGKEPEIVQVESDVDQRSYFSFSGYEYCLDVRKQDALLPADKPLEEGFRESYEWYLKNSDAIRRRPYMEYIDEHFK